MNNRKKKQAHYLRTIDDSDLGMARLDADGRVRDANLRLLGLLGYEWAELEGKSFNDITHPDDRWIGLEVLLDIRSGRQNDVAYEKRFLKKNGRSLWAGVTASSISVDNDDIGVVLMVSDPSLRPAPKGPERELELLRAALVETPIVVFACDRDGLLILCEDRGLKSVLSRGEILGRHVWDVYGNKKVVRNHIQRGLAGESGKFVMRSSGADFTCLYRPIQASDGTVMGVTGLAQDLTALATMTEENLRLSEFMTTLSHELRNPLNTIMGFTELLVNGTYGSLSNRQKKPMRNIEVGGQQLLSLINDILDLAKVKAGHLHLLETPLEAGLIVHSLANEVSAYAELRGLRVVEVAGPAVNFKGDRRRVHQVLLNLLSNAIKFTPAGGTIEIAFSEDARGPRICVSDTGAGLSPDELRLVFEEFGQVAAHQATNPEGAGLGLPLSRKLATLMGGTLLAESTVGVGSRFCLSLPRSGAVAIRPI